MNIIIIKTRGAAQPRARVFIYVMHDCRRHEFVIIFTFYNRQSIQIQPLKLLVICYIGENNLACKFRKKSTLLLCSTVYICITHLSQRINLWRRQAIYIHATPRDAVNFDTAINFSDYREGKVLSATSYV